MLDLRRFCLAQIVSPSRRLSCPPPKAVDCVEVVEVSPSCPARSAGLRKGHLIASVNGRPATSFEDWPLEQRRIVYHDPSRRVTQEVSLSAVDPGIRYELTPEAVIRRFRPERHRPDELVRLWETGYFQELEKLTLQGLRHHGKSTLWDRLLRRPPVVDSPLLLLFGAAIYERGWEKDGWSWIELYREEFLNHWTMQFHAMVTYYEATQAQKAGDVESGLTLLARSYYETPLGRTAALYECWCGEPPSQEENLEGHRFPLDIGLTSLDTGEPASLQDLVTSIDADQLIVVCLLSHYRGNGPYNDLLKWYRANGGFFRGILADFVVVTSKKERPPERDYWFEHEEAALAEGAPLTLLYDPREEVAQAVGQSRAPELYLLDCEGTIYLHSHTLEATHLWNGLHRFSHQ